MHKQHTLQKQKGTFNHIWILEFQVELSMLTSCGESLSTPLSCCFFSGERDSEVEMWYRSGFHCCHLDSAFRACLLLSLICLKTSMCNLKSALLVAIIANEASACTCGGYYCCITNSKNAVAWLLKFTQVSA